jgi:hydrogenase expression/formation protein HypC
MCLAIPAQVSELLDDNQQFATVDVLGVRRRANIELLSDDPPSVGDWVLVHVGFAMSKISAAHAEEQLRLLSMLGETADATDQTQGCEANTDDIAREPPDEIR